MAANATTTTINDAGTDLAHCTGCAIDLPATRMAEYDCAHYNCHNCLERRAKLAISLPNSYYYPIRCCGRAPLSSAVIRAHLTPSTYRQYTALRLERDTKDKTYCSRPTCSTFIKPQSVHNKQATCQTCFSKTCATCKTPWHWGPCKGGDEELAVLAETKGWKQCPSCGRYVEKMYGCLHMR